MQKIDLIKELIDEVARLRELEGRVKAVAAYTESSEYPSKKVIQGILGVCEEEGKEDV